MSTSSGRRGPGRSHREAWAGCTVSLTTPTRSSLKASRSVSSLSLAEKAESVFAASYFPLYTLSCENAHGTQRIFTCWKSRLRRRDHTPHGGALATFEDRKFPWKTNIGLMKV